MNSTLSLKGNNFYIRYILPKVAKFKSEASLAAHCSFQAATKRAIKYEGKNREATKIRLILEPMISDFLENENFDKVSVFGVIELIRREFVGKGIKDWTYGNSQKWINMAIKYYLIAKSVSNGKFDERVFQNILTKTNYTLIPVDGIIIRLIKMALDIEFQWSNWSSCDDLSIFDDYWNSLQGYLAPTIPLVFEVENW